MIDSFKTSNGLVIPVIPGFREKVKSNWKSAFKSFEYSELELDKANHLKKDFLSSMVWLQKYNISISDKNILDVGCYLGLQCISAVEAGAVRATGIDIPEYYINQSLDGNVDASKVLTDRRNQVLDLFPSLHRTLITYEDVSVFDMEYDNEFDLIFSWETFEHIMNPKLALKKMYTALKPGGVSFNLYNPFFSISGGHSMCTLDYPFAHTLLSNDDFKRYIETIVPDGLPNEYASLSYNFFTKNLNRMTQNDLRSYIDEAGFELLDMISLPDVDVLQLISEETYEQSKKLYPTLSLNDFLCSYVYFIIKKND